MELDGDDLRREALDVRKATLRSLLVKVGPGLRWNEHIEGDGGTIFSHACKLGLEGIVSKRKGSLYRSGRSPGLAQDEEPGCAGSEARGRRGLGPGRMALTVLTMRRVREHFVVTGPDIEPVTFKSRREARVWCLVREVGARGRSLAQSRWRSPHPRGQNERRGVQANDAEDRGRL
jgi:hypothetical protein